MPDLELQTYQNRKNMKEVENLQTAETQALNIPVVRRSFFGFKHYYLDSNTRISFGFHLSKLGKSYLLQRKGKLFWKETAWTYDVPFYKPDLIGLINYLYWYEGDKKSVTTECCF